MRSPSFFLNVDLDLDLDLESDEDLSPLVRALEPYAFSLERPPGRASFELRHAVSPADPEWLILEFVRIVEALPAAPRALWNRASSRVFDIGIQSDDRPPQRAYRLAAATLRAAADVGADIVITVYPAYPDEPTGQAR